MRRPVLCAVACLLCNRTALADTRQLGLDVHAGVAGGSGPLGGVGPAVDLGVSYGLNDAFSLYGVAGYSLAFPSVAGLRHDGVFAAGVRYALDYIRAVPYVGVALRADVLDVGGMTWATPGAEIRGGLCYLVNRSLTLDLQGVFAEPFVSTDRTRDFFTVSLGVGYLLDL